MKKKYKISVITINFNNREGLKQTLSSVASQTNQNFEYIVIDGNSTDGSVDILREYTRRLDYWTSEQDKNEYDGMNKGIQRATGEYLIFLNSGDTFYSENSIAEILAHEFREDFLYADVCVDYQSRTEIKRYPDNLSAWFLFSDMICHQVQIISRRLFVKLGLYDDRIKIVADYDFMLRALIAGKANYKHIPVILATYAWGGKSSQPEAAKFIFEEKLKIQSKYFSQNVPESLRALDYEVYQNYLRILNSRSYRILRLITRFDFLNRIGNFFLDIVVRLKRLFQRWA